MGEIAQSDVYENSEEREAAEGIIDTDEPEEIDVVKIVRENEELRRQNEALKKQLDIAQKNIVRNVVNAIQWIDGETVVYEDLIRTIECPVTDGKKLELYIMSGEDDNIFLKGYINEKGVISDEDGRILNPDDMMITVPKKQYNSLVARAEYEMEAFSDASEAVSKAIERMSAAGISTNVIQNTLQQYLDSKSSFVKGIHTVSMIPAGLVKPRNEELEARGISYGDLIKDYKEITSTLWGICKIAQKAISRHKEKKMAAQNREKKITPIRPERKEPGIAI